MLKPLSSQRISPANLAIHLHFHQSGKIGLTDFPMDVDLNTIAGAAQK
ncbi:hypothetical protein C8D87_103470 [Lentzea atacamensis]|uniref:Uncharacterized protein n=1 Tax=Lentzea atacamensis TaxID=531938 RepID=A0ABX9ED47_9PSEU|nr:hypothetical protein C8D87_103470 [Lentzea atacamensis]